MENPQTEGLVLCYKTFMCCECERGCETTASGWMDVEMHCLLEGDKAAAASCNFELMFITEQSPLLKHKYCIYLESPQSVNDSM